MIERGQRAYARQNRMNPTLGETILWHELKSKKFRGLKFRRQFPIRIQGLEIRKDFFIVDFCCCSLSLVIEIDGNIHGCLVEEDRAREGYLKERGYKILRIPDSVVRLSPDLALQMISDFIEKTT